VLTVLAGIGAELLPPCVLVVEELEGLFCTAHVATACLLDELATLLRQPYSCFVCLFREWVANVDVSESSFV